MRVATWNINGLRARIDYLRLWLETRQPDVVALQELKLTDEQFPHDELAELGYRAVHHGQKAWNGVAIVTRQQLEPQVTQTGLPGQEALGSRLLTVEVAGVSFTSVYCPNGKSVDHEDYPKKLAWFDALADHLAARHAPDEPVLIGGDLNICPAAIDSWNEASLAGSIFHTEAERQRLQRLLDWGLVDLFRRQHPDTQAFSWWDYRGGAFRFGHGLRIDLLLASRSVAERVTSVVIDRDWRKKKDGLTASDHAPVVADLAEISPRPPA
jgi:exodeoxyribonuclease-3